jgi:hypothetical protein
MAAELAEEERVKAAKAAAEAAELKAAEEAKLKAEREREAALSAARNAREKRGKMRNQQWVAVVDKPTRSDVVTAAGANPSGSAPQAPPAPPRAGATVTSTPPLDRNRDDGHPERGPAEAAVETREGTGSESNGSQLPVCSLDSEPQRLALLSPEEREKERVQASHGRVVWAVARMLTRQGSDGPFSGVLALPRARVPIVKFKHDPSGISCDLGVNNRLAVVNSRLLATYLAADPRARPLVAVCLSLGLACLYVAVALCAAGVVGETLGQVPQNQRPLPRNAFVVCLCVAGGAFPADAATRRVAVSAARGPARRGARAH